MRTMSMDVPEVGLLYGQPSYTPVEEDFPVAMSQ